MIADTADELQRLVDKLDVEFNRVGLKINIDKTEVMGVTKRKEEMKEKAVRGIQTIKQVRSFKYLGSLMSENGRCDAEIRSRIAMGKARFGQLRGTLTNMNLSREIQRRVLQSYIRPGMIYGCESWTISKENKKSLEATEAWFLRRMLRIPWIARRTNKEVLQISGTKRELLTAIMKIQLGFLGHVLRSYGLESTCVLGMIEGKRARGRHGLTYMHGLKEAADIRIEKVTKLARDRKKWKSIVTTVIFDKVLR